MRSGGRAAMNRSALLAGIVVILVAAVTLGYHLRDWTTPRSSEESAGTRLRRECESIVEAVGGPRVSQVEVAQVLEERAEIAEELRKKGFSSWAYSKKAEFLLGHPAWNSGLEEALDRARERMIRSCVLKRGLETR